MDKRVEIAPRKNLLSIMIPVYNEANTLGAVIDRVRAVTVQEGVHKEIIVVDDGSTDGTEAILRTLKDDGITVVRHPQNRGKGAAVRTALDHATGEWALIQDADLEYAPEDYPELIAPFLRDPSIGAVFGSRFMGNIEGMMLPNFIANKLLTWFTNLLFHSRITDLCTGYKLYRTETVREIPLVRDGFDLEHELTAKLLKKGCNIVDVPITYTGRDVSAGKKVRWTDFFINIKTLLKYRFSGI
ncbi:MAG: glycosyltransferase family 2 protein [Gemmatimonadetes bacterium]|nr:glycosyltransferase family 2 protein [Gemmatimonadota bacterium]